MLAGALRVAGVWLSPPILLGVAPLLLADGTRGLWGPLGLAAGAALVAVVLAAPWAGLPAGRPTLEDLARHRWPSAGSALLPLTAVTSGSALLFLWAQLAAGREVARTFGWSPAVLVTVATIVLALAAWRAELGAPVAVLGGGVALVGVLLPLAVVVGVTDPAWPRVWDEVASRARPVFRDGPWVREGRPVRGVGPEVTLPVTDEQNVTLLGRGRVRVELWEGRTWSREVSGATELTLRPGDRLVVPDGFPARFRVGRTIPGAPASGMDWLAPGEGAADWRALAGLGVTLLVGALGLAPVHAALPARRSGGDRAVALGAVFVVLGLAATILWSLYAAWWMPEIYLGGVVGSEIYELPAMVPALGPVGIPLRALAVLGLAGGGVAAALAALAGIPRAPRRDGRQGVLGAGSPALGVVLAAGALGGAVPVAPWPLLLAAFGLAASACAPAAVFVCWRERLSARGVAAGATVGLLVFVALTGLRLWHLSGAGGAPGSWLGWLAAWPALLAMPLNALAAWLLSAGPRPSPRAPLPPGFAELHG